MSSNDSNKQHKGYYRRRKTVPHFDKAGLTQVITFRLTDSLPVHVLMQMKAEADMNSDAEKRKRIEQFLDAGYGECHLKLHEVAELVEGALLFFDVTSIEEEAERIDEDSSIGKTDRMSVVREGRYRLIAWVIMPNHVHVMIELLAGHPMDKIVQSWKSYTANKANEILGRKGHFWAEDYFDRFIRDQEHFNNAVRYLHHNPVKAGLVYHDTDWSFSSASLQE